MPRPIINDAALDDIENIWFYIAVDSVGAADGVVDGIYEAAYALALNPGIGHSRKDISNQTLRFWRVHSYLLVYRECGDQIEIVRVLSGWRDIGLVQL